MVDLAQEPREPEVPPGVGRSLRESGGAACLALRGPVPERAPPVQAAPAAGHPRALGPLALRVLVDRGPRPGAPRAHGLRPERRHTVQAHEPLLGRALQRESAEEETPLAGGLGQHGHRGPWQHCAPCLGRGCGATAPLAALPVRAHRETSRRGSVGDACAAVPLQDVGPLGGPPLGPELQGAGGLARSCARAWGRRSGTGFASAAHQGSHRHLRRVAPL
mmetsp:Transcript_33202/g.67117  ORF Transcript_33202/g.67117 Transcript_33202/m.67117 type:complete len:220 (-) Transcript_33202:126-785(-)